MDDNRGDEDKDGRDGWQKRRWDEDKNGRDGWMAIEPVDEIRGK